MEETNFVSLIAKHRTKSRTRIMDQVKVVDVHDTASEKKSKTFSQTVRQKLGQLELQRRGTYVDLQKDETRNITVGAINNYYV
jgi:hypothetical protein